MGATYSPDLVRGRTTHVVCATTAAAVPSERSMKPGKALEWGVPRVHLDWLLDSACALEALPIEPYLLQPEAEREEKDKGKNIKQLIFQQQQHEEAAAPRAAIAVPHKRPSSVASNFAPAPAAMLQPPPQQHQHQQQGFIQVTRPALGPLAQNALAAELSDRLRSMSISPEPSKHFAAGGRRWHSSGSEEEQAERVGSRQQQAEGVGSRQQQAQQQVQQQQQEPWHHHAGAKQQQQRTPVSAGSSQRSLSLLGIVQRRLSGSPCGSPAAIDRGGDMPRPPAGTPAPGPSPMSVAAGSPSAGQQPQTEAAFAFSPAAALASPLSPMAESPAAALAMARSSGGVGRGTEPMLVQQRQSSQCRHHSWRSSLAPCPSPAPLRGLSDSSDVMQLGASPAGTSPGSTYGLTQTPQVVKDALLLTAPSPLPAPAHVTSTPPLEQAAVEAAGSDVGHLPPAHADAAMALMCTPAAVRDWTDDDDVSVAPDQPSPCDIVPDSEDEESREEAEELESSKSSCGQQLQQVQQAATFCTRLQQRRPSAAERSSADTSLAARDKEPLAELSVAALVAASPLDGDGGLCELGDGPSRLGCSTGPTSEQWQQGPSQQQHSQRLSQHVADWSEDDSSDGVPSPAGDGLLD